MATVLEKIISAKRAEVEKAKMALPLLEVENLAKSAPPPRDFYQALLTQREKGQVGLIAEIKRKSPSQGIIRENADPAEIAQAYEKGGAACLSVLTDRAHFGGSPEDLKTAREACQLPVLRKDFIIDPYQVPEARGLGADCILLILAVLDDKTAHELEFAAMELGMSVLLEVHDQAELERALAMESPLVGINNRDLKTLKVHPETAIELAKNIPENKLVVAESGLKTHQDLMKYRDDANISTFLVGETLMRQVNLENAVKTLLEGEMP